MNSVVVRHLRQRHRESDREIADWSKGPEVELDNLARSIEIASTLGVQIIRVFSFYPPEGRTQKRTMGMWPSRPSGCRRWLSWRRGKA